MSRTAAVLDPRIETIRAKYDLDPSDFWELPMKKGTWLVKHSALEVVAAKAGIRFDLPTIIEAHGGEGVAAVCVQGVKDARSEWSIGECSPKNNKNAYPWAMAEKRAKDRVILKLEGIHGLVYSEDEISDEADTMPKAKARPVDRELRDEIDACATLDQLATLWRSEQFQKAFKQMPMDWQQSLIEHKDQHKAGLQAQVPPPAGYVDPRDQFNAMERQQ